jgi:hypothetical protein
MTEYVDKYGKKITHEEMIELAIDQSYCRIKKTQVAHIDGEERIEVSTVWLPGSKSVPEGKPVFETMIFGGPETGWMKQYTSLEEAQRGHDFAIHLCTGMRTQDRLVK